MLNRKYHHMDELKHMHNLSNFLDYPQDNEVACRHSNHFKVSKKKTSLENI